MIVSEIDPICALQATMEGYTVAPMEDVLPNVDIFITTTGNKDIIMATDMSKMKNNAIVGNIGHFDNEIDMAGLLNTKGEPCSLPCGCGRCLLCFTTLLQLAASIEAQTCKLCTAAHAFCGAGYCCSELRMLAGIKRQNIKPQCDRFIFPDGHGVIILAEGRLLNLGCATGHPSFVMSCSFTNQACPLQSTRPFLLGLVPVKGLPPFVKPCAWSGMSP